MIFAAERRRRASRRGRHRAPAKKPRYSAGRLGARTLGLLLAAAAMAAAAPADAGLPAAASARTVVHLVLHPMPAGAVSFGRDGRHRLTVHVSMFGLTPGSSHAVQLAGPGRGLVRFTTLTASSAGQADANLTSRFTGHKVRGSRLVIRMGTQASGIGTEPIATTRPLGRRGVGPHRLTAVEVTSRGASYGTPHGKASLTYNSNRHTLTVAVSASGVSPGPHAAHIHLGSCMSQGPVAYMLKDLVANRHGRIVHAVRVFTEVKDPIPPTGWYLNIHQGNSADILSNGHPTIYFRPLICANVRTTGISAILKPADVVTGVRGTSHGQVVLTGGQATGSGTQNHPFLFRGPLSTAAGAPVSVLIPPFPAVTSATFYGPDTHRFNPAIPSGQVRAVGAYQSSAAPAGVVNRGMIYLGPVSGAGGSWTSVAVPPDGSRTTGHRRACPRHRRGCFVMDTIPHSTMGDLVVGNYDLNPAGPGSVITANAFIYDLTTRRWTLVDLGRRMSDQTTLYGIWQDGGPHSPRYTLAGGSFASGRKRAFLITYNELTGAFGRPAFFSFGNHRTLVTHFEGITAVPGGFHVVAMSSRHPASMAFIPVLADGSFGTARWFPIDLRASSLCSAGCSAVTGNTVFQNKVMGLYLPTGASLPGTYLADVATRH